MSNPRQRIIEQEIKSSVEQLQIISKRYQTHAQFDPNKLAMNEEDAMAHRDLLKQVLLLIEKKNALLAFQHSGVISQLFTQLQPSDEAAPLIKYKSTPALPEIPQDEKTYPPISYIWIGAPTPTLFSQETTGVAGHDVMGVISMAAVNKKNPLFFWCLDENVKIYQHRLENYPVTIISIEKRLLQALENPAYRQTAEILEKIQTTTLNPSRNTIRDRVSFKNVISLFILLVEGGYVLDTNITPESHLSDFNLLKNSEFRFPVFSCGDPDVWMLHAPKNSKKTTDVLRLYHEKWNQVEKYFQEVGGYNSEYYQRMAKILISSISHDDNYKTWEATRVGSSAFIKELGIIKSLFNTHKYKQRQEHESKESMIKNSFTLFMGKQKILNFPINQIIFDYFYEESDLLISDFLKTIPVKKSAYSEIYYMIYDDNIIRLTALINYGANINEQISYGDIQGETPLHWAILTKKHDCVRLLLNRGADLTLRAKYPKMSSSVTPHELASSYPEYKHSKLIIEEFLKDKITLTP